MKKLLVLLFVLISSVCFSQEQEVKTDSCHGQPGLKLKTTVVYNKKKKDYTINNKVEGGKIIDTIYLTVNGLNVDTIKTLKNIQSGNYRSRFIDERGCTIENIGWIYIDGHELNEIEPKITKCFPIPFKNNLNIEYDIPTTDKYYIFFSGVKTELDPLQTTIKIDTKKISVGVYIVQLLKYNEIVGEYKIMKLK